MRFDLSRSDHRIQLCGDLHFEVVERRIPGAPAFLRGLRVLFITDTHVAPRTTREHLAAFTEKLAACRPSLVLWGGDFADKAGDAVRLFEALSGLAPTLGSFGVVGNNDRQAWPDIYELRSAMRKAGIRLLLNESLALDTDGGKLIIAGVDEYRYGEPDACGLYPEEASPGCYRLLLSHYPILPTQKPDLMLSGHTHGGQFDLMGITPYTIGFERKIQRLNGPMHVSGLSPDGRVLTSSGIGASRLPLRIGVRPEVELLTFG